MARVYAGERFEKVAFDGGRVGDAGITEEEREDRSKGRPDDQHCRENPRRIAVEALHKSGDDILPRFAPRALA